MARPVQLFMFCAVYGPSALILVICYGYIYFVARGHARAISEVRYSLNHSPPVNDGTRLDGNGNASHASSPSTSSRRYGVALAITTGMFLALWLPFQVGNKKNLLFAIFFLFSGVQIYYLVESFKFQLYEKNVVH